MPAAAMGTPVLLIDDPKTLPGGGGHDGELRMAGLEDVVHMARPEDGIPKWLDFDNPAPNPNAATRAKHSEVSKVRRCRLTIPKSWSKAPVV
jgi:hypothetical protein